MLSIAKQTHAMRAQIVFPLTDMHVSLQGESVQDEP